MKKIVTSTGRRAKRVSRIKIYSHLKLKLIVCCFVLPEPFDEISDESIDNHASEKDDDSDATGGHGMGGDKLSLPLKKRRHSKVLVMICPEKIPHFFQKTDQKLISDFCQSIENFFLKKSTMSQTIYPFYQKKNVFSKISSLMMRVVRISSRILVIIT